MAKPKKGVKIALSIKKEVAEDNVRIEIAKAKGTVVASGDQGCSDTNCGNYCSES